MFSVEVQNVVSERTRVEFSSACQCFAFGLYTASGFHAGRAIESQLLEYCKNFKLEIGEKDTWGNLIEKLENPKNKKKADIKTIGQLKQLKKFDRNPIVHLKSTLSETDADILINNAKVVITSMALEMPKKKI